jgi:hypothetical protein
MGKSLQHCLAVAQHVFATTAVYAASQGCVLVLEANPPIYNCDFLSTAKDAQMMVRRVGRWCCHC